LTNLQQYRATRPWLHPKFLWQLSPSGREEARLIKVVHAFTNKVRKPKNFLCSSQFTNLIDYS